MPDHEPRSEDEAARGGFSWRPRQIFDLLKRTGKEWAEDKTPKQAAALAYYTLFALGPLLVLAVSIAGLVFGADAVREAVVGQISRVTGESGGQAIGDAMVGAMDEGSGVVGTILGIAVLLIAATGVFSQLKDTLNRIWEVEHAPVEGWKAKVVDFVRTKMASFAAVLGTGFLLAVSLLLTTAIAAAGTFMSGWMPGGQVVWQVVNVLLQLLILTGVFALLFRFVPDARVAWRDVGIGASVTAVLFLAGQLAIGYYLGTGAVGDRFGAGSAIIVVLVWVYYSALILFFGAEFTQVYANLYGSRVRASDEGVSYKEAVQQEQSHPPQEGVEEGRKPTRGGRGAT